MPLTLASDWRASPVARASRPRDARVSPERPWGDAPVAPDWPPTLPRASPASPRGGMHGSPASAPPMRGGTPVYLGGGDRTLGELRAVIRTLDRDPPICPHCRERPRQFCGLNPWNGHRKYRMLCAPCQRDLRVAAGFEDLPALICRECWERPRALKEYRRGRPRWRRLCWPCGRAARVARGLAADRGARDAPGVISRVHVVRTGSDQRMSIRPPHLTHTDPRPISSMHPLH